MHLQLYLEGGRGNGDNLLAGRCITDGGMFPVGRFSAVQLVTPRPPQGACTKAVSVPMGLHWASWSNLSKGPHGIECRLAAGTVVVETI
jgi:hypothetical protein